MAEIIWHSNSGRRWCFHCGAGYIPRRNSRFCIDCIEQYSWMEYVPKLEHGDRFCRGNAVERYVKLFKHVATTLPACAIPRCRKRIGVQIHHIVPLKYGGPDALWNLIPLCAKHHRGNALHLEDKLGGTCARLLTWKFITEQRYLGYVVDDEKEFYTKVREAKVQFLEYHQARTTAV